MAKGLFAKVFFFFFNWEHHILLSGENIARYSKRQKRKEKKKLQFEESEQISKPYKAGMLGVTNQELKTSILNILRCLIDKVEDMQQQMGNLSTDMQILRNNQKEILH